MLRIAPFCVAYRWWDAEPLERSPTPVLASIACFRHFHPAVPVIVLDHSGVDHDWSRWADVFHITVLRQRSFFDDLPAGPRAHKKLCGKPFDLHHVHCASPCNPILFLDSDLFLLAPLGLCPTDRVQSTGNTGLLFYRRSDRPVRLLFDAWCDAVERMLRDAAFADGLLARYGGPYGILEDEVAFRHVIAERPELHAFLDHRLNFFVNHDGPAAFRPLPENPSFTPPPVTLHVRARTASKIAAALSYREVHAILTASPLAPILPRVTPERSVADVPVRA